MKIPPKLRRKIVLESQELVSDAVETTHEELIPAMVEQFERNTTDFLQEKYASDSPYGHKADIDNIDDDTHIPIATEF